MFSKTLFTFFQYAYLAIFAFASWLVWENWHQDRNRAYVFLIFAIGSLVMFFLKRNFKKKYENRD